MDSFLQKKFDALVESEIFAGSREVESPAAVVIALQEAQKVTPSLPTPSKFRLAKLNPQKRSQITQLVVAKHTADLKNPELLSKKAVRALNVQHELWSEEEERRIERLQMSTGQAMSELGAAQLDMEWAKPIQEAAQIFLDALVASDKHEDEKKFLQEKFTRWVAFTKDSQELYNTEYAKSQEQETYSPDIDLRYLYDTSPSGEASDALAQIDEIQFKLEKYTILFQEREELKGLLEKQARMYNGTIESRQETNEQMAQLYFGVTVLNEAGQPVGPITQTFEQFWELPDELVTWLIEEYYFFINVIPRAMKDHLDSWSFTVAGRSQQLLAAYGEQPDQSSSKTDSTQPVETDSNSSDIATPTS